MKWRVEGGVGEREESQCTCTCIMKEDGVHAAVVGLTTYTCTCTCMWVVYVHAYVHGAGACTVHVHIHVHPVITPSLHPNGRLSHNNYMYKH